MILDLLAGPVRSRTISARICLGMTTIRRMTRSSDCLFVDSPQVWMIPIPRSKAKAILTPRNSYNSAVLTPSASRSLRDLQISSQDAPAAEVF